MAIFANSTRTSTVQPLLRVAGPCRVLTDAEVIVLTAVPIDTLEMLYLTEPGIKRGHMSTVALPDFGDLKSALSRRRAIFGAHAAEVDHG